MTRALMVAVLVALSAGCASIPRVESTVESIARADSAQKTKFYILPGDDGVERDDLQFQEYITYVKPVLASRGFVIVDDIYASDIIIYLSYGVSDPQTYEYSYAVPTYGQTGVASSSTTGSITPNGNGVNYSGTTTYTPTYGITGSKTYNATGIIYSRHISLRAIDSRAFYENNKQEKVWQTVAVSTGESGDLRLIFPYMVVAMKPYIGKSTRQRIDVSTPVNDPAVRALQAAAP